MSLIERLLTFIEQLKDKDTEVYVAGADRYTVLTLLLQDALDQIRRE